MNRSSSHTLLRSSDRLDTGWGTVTALDSSSRLDTSPESWNDCSNTLGGKYKDELNLIELNFFPHLQFINMYKALQNIF